MGQALAAPGHKKIRLLLVEDPKAEGMKHVRAYEEEEARALGDRPPSRLNSVEIVGRLSNADYDTLLSQSVVFLDLIDASAATTVVECLARGTPLLINPLPAVREYLGHDYPLYFSSLDEATEKIGVPELVRAAHEHMVANPMRRRIEPQRFLDDVAATCVYRDALRVLSLLRGVPEQVNGGDVCARS